MTTAPALDLMTAIRNCAAEADRLHRLGPVRLHEQRRRLYGQDVTLRLYSCANGWSLTARRGGPLCLADDSTWELFVMDPSGIRVINSDGTLESAGWVTDEQLDRAVTRLASYWVGAQSVVPSI